MIREPNIPTELLNQKQIILFDGVCYLCSGWLHFVHKRDKLERLKFATVQSDVGAKLLIYCGLPTDRFDTMVYIENGIPYYKSEAFLRIVKHLPNLWPLLSIGQICPAIIRDWLYDRIAQNRYNWFGIRETCMLPNEELKNRFLDS